MTNQNHNQTPIFDLNLFDIKKDSAIEASAGTGKTYTIKKIIKKILLDGVSLVNGIPTGKPSVRLDQILIVTYTEKAAGELKERIRDEITTPLSELGGKSLYEYLGDDYCNIEKTTIGTIHSFCQSTIEEFSISSNQPLGLELAGDNIINDFAKAYIRKGDIFKDINDSASQGVLIDENKLIKYLLGVLKHYYLDYSYNEVKSVIEYELPLSVLLRNSSNIRQTLLEHAHPAIYDAYDRMSYNADPTIQKFIAAFNDFENFCNSKLTATAYDITKKKGFSDDVVEDCNTLLEVGKKLAKDDAIEKTLTAKYIKDFYRAYQEYKGNNRLHTFDDMLRVVREELMKDNSLLLEKLKEKYIYGIIDEFQDTNQIQFDVFEKIFLKDEKEKKHYLIVVGDPKQSIYSFQGADVEVYLKAVKTITANGDKWRLATNHRSAAGIVAFGNELFKKYFDAQNGGGITFEESKYCYIGDGNNPEKERRVKYKGQYCPSLWLPNNNLNDKEYAYYAVQEILNCLEVNKSGETNLRLTYIEDGKQEERNAKFSDFVVLARAKSELNHIQRVLKNAGIPNVRYKDDTLFRGIECAHWIALLEAIDVVDFTGYNRCYFRKALYTKFFNYSLNEISKEKYNNNQIPEIALFEKWRGIAKEETWEELFDTIIADTNLEKTLSSRTETKTLANFKQIADYAIDYLSNGFKIKDLINHLNAVVSFGNEESEGDNPFIVAKSTALDCVRLMTIHASKGLQFPVVISVAGWSGPKVSDDAYNYHKKNANGSEKHVVALESSPEIAEEEKEEYFRLLYVDYTRPEYLLIMPRFDRGDKTGRPDVRNALNSFIATTQQETVTVDGKQVPLYEFRDTSYGKAADMEKAAGEAIKHINKNHVKETENNKNDQNQVLQDLIKEEKKIPAYQHSYSTLAHPKNKDESFDEENLLDREGIVEDDLSQYDQTAQQIEGKYVDTEITAKTPDDGYPKGAGMGSAIHEVFENVDFMDPDSNVEDIIIDRFKSYGFAFEKGSDYLQYTKENIVKTVLEAELPSIVGSKEKGQPFRLKDLSSSCRKAEAEFDFNYPNETLKNYFIGFVDLLFMRQVDGVDVYSILDWKSDTLSDKFLSYKDKDELRNQVNRRYSVQRVIYSYCLIKWLKTFYNLNEEEVFNEHFGGIYYVFIRGCNKGTSNGIYAQTWKSWSDLEKSFLEICKIK